MSPLWNAITSLLLFVSGCLLGATIMRLALQVREARRRRRDELETYRFYKVIAAATTKALQQFEYMANGASPTRPEVRRAGLGMGLSESELERLKRIANRKDPEA